MTLADLCQMTGAFGETDSAVRHAKSPAEKPILFVDHARSLSFGRSVDLGTVDDEQAAGNSHRCRVQREQTASNPGGHSTCLIGP
jgi:hypothetical protein